MDATVFSQDNNKFLPETPAAKESLTTLPPYDRSLVKETRYLNGIPNLFEYTLYPKGFKPINMQTMVRYLTQERVELVTACAWCPRSKHPVLKKNQEYTHGVCSKHLHALMGSLKRKHVKV